MQYFEEEINYPLNLVLTCRNWSVIAKNPYAKTEWLIVHYGKAHALFHVLRLDPTFINIPLCQALIARKVVISRHIIQRLLMYFGRYDQKLIELHISQFNADGIRAFQQKIKSSQLSNVGEVLPPKRNDMKLFNFLSINSHITRYVPGMLKT